ncbi:hypothetical protein BDV98DRAFT_562770 [Pterulicium gracile]|uniref:Uncharacterized protein n=1 Tax=Pterulicium gracile TaxID=1884261 RepID=A0A5C3QRZ9_9AGAR|nr:hypothetical protein BDV98DRAFT_562770 [Pterula gracilis]
MKLKKLPTLPWATIDLPVFALPPRRSLCLSVRQHKMTSGSHTVPVSSHEGAILTFWHPSPCLGSSPRHQRQ